MKQTSQSGSPVAQNSSPPCLWRRFFSHFLLQILFRYVPFLEPIGWSVVLISSAVGVRHLSSAARSLFVKPITWRFDVLYLGRTPPCA